MELILLFSFPTPLSRMSYLGKKTPRVNPFIRGIHHIKGLRYVDYIKFTILRNPLKLSEGIL